MAVEHAHGAIQWNSADGVGTNYTISGLPFQPKAFRFYWMGLSAAADGSGQLHWRGGVGFGSDGGAARCVAVTEAHAAGTSLCGSMHRNDSVVATLSPIATPAPDGRLALNSVNSDGFTLQVTDAAPVNITVFYDVWGGSDIVGSEVMDINEPTVTGNVDYAAADFTAGGTDQVVMFAGCQSIAGTGVAANTDAGLCMGFATSGDVADQCVVATSSDDAAATMITDCYSVGGECLAQIVVGGAGTVNARARLTQFGAGNFRLNWIARGLTGRRYIALAIKGGQWKAGGFTIDGSTVGNTGGVSGLAFQPEGLCVIDAGNNENTAGSGVALGRLGIGVASSPTSRRAMSYTSADGPTTSAIGIAIEYDQVNIKADNGGVGTDVEYDLQSFNSDGFTLVVDSVSTSPGTTDWKGYLVWASLAGAGATDLVLSDGAQAQSSDNLTLTTSFNLTVADAVQAQAVDNIALTQLHLLVVQDATQSQPADNVALIVNLNVSEAIHGQASDNMTLTAAGALVITDATHAQSSDGIVFTQEHNVTVQDAAHAHSAEDLALVQVHFLVLGEALHGQTADNTILDTPPELNIHDALHGGGGGFATQLIVSVME